MDDGEEGEGGGLHLGSNATAEGIADCSRGIVGGMSRFVWSYYRRHRPSTSST